MSLNSADGPFDLFVIAGQSNAEGRGSSASSPSLTGLAYLYSGAIVDLADPVGGADTGSAWPAFANAWTAATGRVPVFVEQATGSSALLAAAESTGGNWSTTGTLFDACVVAANAAKAEIGADLGNTYVVWSQGERDAEAINGTTVTAALYKTALMELAERFYASLNITKMFVFITGEKDNGEYLYNYSAIRQSQRDACKGNGRLINVFDRAQYFPAESKMTDTVHYNQSGLNEMGDTGGDNAALVFDGQNITPASQYNNVATRMVTESYLRLNTSQHAQVVVDPAITPATDFTIAVKFKWLAGTSNPYLLTLGRVGTGYDDFAIIFGDTAKSIDFYRVRNGTVDGTLVNFFTAGNPYQDGETHIAILQVDGLNLKAWIDTDEGQTFTGASAQTFGVNILTLNARWAGSVSRQSDSQFYYAYIYDVLSDADITALMAGANPETVGTIRQGYNLIDESEVNGGTSLTLYNSPTFYVPPSHNRPLISNLIGSLIGNLIT